MWEFNLRDVLRWCELMVQHQVRQPQGLSLHSDAPRTVLHCSRLLAFKCANGTLCIVHGVYVPVVDAIALYILHVIQSAWGKSWTSCITCSLTGDTGFGLGV